MICLLRIFMPGKSISVSLEWRGTTETSKGSVGVVNIKMGPLNYKFKPQNYFDGKPDVLTIADTDLLESLALNAVIFPTIPSAESSSSAAPYPSFKQSLWTDTLKRPAARGLSTSFQLVEVQTSSEQIKIALPTSYIEGEVYKLVIINDGSSKLLAKLELLTPHQEIKPVTIACTWKGTTEFYFGGQIGLIELGLSTKFYTLSLEKRDSNEPQFLQIETGSSKVDGLRVKNTELFNTMSLKAAVFTPYDDHSVATMYPDGTIHYDQRVKREDIQFKCVLPTTFTPGETYELIITNDGKSPLSAQLVPGTLLNREVLQAVSNIFKGLLITKLVEIEMKLKPQLGLAVFASLAKPNQIHISMIEQKLAGMVKGLGAVDINKLAVLIKERDEAGFASYFMMHGGKEKIEAVAKNLFQTIHPSADKILIQKTCERFMEIATKHLSPKLSEVSHQ